MGNLSKMKNKMFQKVAVVVFSISRLKKKQQTMENHKDFQSF